MSNMSYCRFENTANDLGDCLRAINNNEVWDLSSDYEVDGLRRLLRYAKCIVEQESFITNAIENQ